MQKISNERTFSSLLPVIGQNQSKTLNGIEIKGRIRLFFFVFLFVCSPLSQAAKVKKISIEGNKIIETELILSHIQLREGSFYNEKTIQRDVRRLFSLGFFDDIEVHKKSSKTGLNILYRVKERIHIGEVEFKGNDRVNTEDLKELSLIEEHEFLDFNSFQETALAIKEKYKEKGYYFVEVSYKTEKIPKENKFKLIIEIKENKKLLVKKVSFIGNRNISSNTLKAFMLTKEKNLLSFLSSSGTFNPDHIDRDLQVIEYYYRDKGYLNVRVQKPEINITPDKKFLYISFSISEGPRFKLGHVVFQGDDIVPTEKVMDKLNLKGKEYFSLGGLQADMKLISVLYKDKGYAFVKVEPLFSADKIEEDKVHILFKVEKGELYKVGRILTSGNNNTRDKVILRRFRIKEGDLYSESKKELTRELIQRLGYFENVDLKPVKSETVEDEVDLLVDVKERERTGELQLSGGYNPATKIFIRTGVRKENFLGLGQSLAVDIRFNKYEEVAALGYQSPYFLDSNWNFAFDIFNVSQDTLSDVNSSNSLFASRNHFSPYSRLNTGFSVSLGRHVTEFFTLFLKYRLQYQQLSGDSIYFLRRLPLIKPVFEFLFGEEEKQTTDEPWRVGIFNDIYDLNKGKGLNSSLVAILEYDKRNDLYYASKGFFTSLSVEYSGLGGHFDYTKLRGKFQHYYSPFWKLVIKNRLEYGLVFPNKRGETVPFTELFLLGGPYNLKGFPINSQGPRRYSEDALKYAQQYNRDIEKAKMELPGERAKLKEFQTRASMKKNRKKIKELRAKIRRYEEMSSAEPLVPESFAWRPYGSSQMIFYSLELEFPIFERVGLRGALFFDIGEANDKLLFKLNDKDLRTDVGVGIRWRSPFGPLSLDLARPYRYRKDFGEENWQFQFSFGSGF